jgi:peptidoglycan-N-acetylglucosamine deacetylase
MNMKELEAAFWQKKLCDLDSDIEVQNLRKAAFGMASINMKTQSVNVNSTSIITNTDLSQGHISLTFDDGPHPVATRLILRVLKSHNVSCNFFQLGTQAIKYPIITRWLREGQNIVGSHSMTHTKLTDIPEEAAKRDIIEGNASVSTALGQKAQFFRFPYGAQSKSLEQFVHENGLVSFLYNIDSYDWNFAKYYDSDLRLLLKGIILRVEQAGGGILLLHDTKQTAFVLPDLLNYMKIKRFTLVKFIPY